MTMETRCCQKKFEFQRYPPKYFCTARYEHKSSKVSNFSTTPKKIFLGQKLFKNPEKKNPGRVLGQDRPEKTQPNVHSNGEIPSPRQTSIDKTNNCAMKSEWGALVRGSDPPSGHSVNKTTGDTGRAPARGLIQTHLGAAV